MENWGQCCGLQIYPSPLNFPPPLPQHTCYTLWDTSLQPFSTPEETGRQRYRRKPSSTPTPSVWSPPGDKSGKEGQASPVWESLSFPAASEPVSQPQLLPISHSTNWDSSLLTLKLHSSFKLTLLCLGCIVSLGDITCPSLYTPPQPNSLLPLLHPLRISCLLKTHLYQTIMGQSDGKPRAGRQTPNSRRRVATNLLGGGIQVV